MIQYFSFPSKSTLFRYAGKHLRKTCSNNSRDMTFANLGIDWDEANENGSRVFNQLSDSFFLLFLLLSFTCTPPTSGLKNKHCYSIITVVCLASLCVFLSLLIQHSFLLLTDAILLLLFPILVTDEKSFLRKKTRTILSFFFSSLL